MSDRSYAWHHRQLKDLPCSGLPVRFDLKVRRWACSNPRCDRKTFIHAIPDLFEKHARRTTRLQGLVTYIACAAGGLPGQRILEQIGIQISDDTLLRSLKRQAAESGHDLTATVVGIDEWSQSYKSKYGTIIVDLEKRQVIDVLETRDTDTVRAWFQAHPGIKVINRDRCSGFARAAREGAPDTIQIADRFHILDNFKDNIEQQLSLRRHKTKLAMFDLAPHEKRLASAEPWSLDKRTTAAQHRAQVRMTKIQSREVVYQRARKMAEEGESVRHIALTLGFKPKTIYRWFRNGGRWHRREKPIAKTSPQYFEAFLKERWEAGETNGAHLLAALKERGYQGSRATLFRYLAPWRQEQRSLNPPNDRCCDEKHNYELELSASLGPLIDPVTGNSIPPQIAAALCMKPTRMLTPRQRIKVEAMKEAAPEFAVMRSLALRLRGMLRGKDPEKLRPWIKDVNATGLNRMMAFATKLLRDEKAVETAIRNKWSYGQTEGQVNRLKTLNSSMYGRASVEMIKARLIVG